MKRMNRIAVALLTLTFGLALALPAEAHDRRDRGHRVEHRHHKHQKHKRFDRHERRHQRDQRIERRYERRHRDEHRYEHRYDRRHRYDRFDIPRHIHHQKRHVYRPYFEGTVYFAPHRHRHSLYLFPVRIGGAWTYREHSYCGDALFLDHARFEYHGPRFSIRIGH